MAESTVTRKTGAEGRGVQKVQSRSNPSTYHWVDIRTQSCSCKGFSFKGECRHLRLVNAQPYAIVAVHDSRVPGMRYDIYGPEGYEGRCVSYADAHDVVTLDLGGFVANHPGAA